jgi:hypothetical protein
LVPKNLVKFPAEFGNLLLSVFVRHDGILVGSLEIMNGSDHPQIVKFVSSFIGERCPAFFRILFLFPASRACLAGSFQERRGLRERACRLAGRRLDSGIGGSILGLSGRS